MAAGTPHKWGRGKLSPGVETNANELNTAATQGASKGAATFKACTLRNPRVDFTFRHWIACSTSNKSLYIITS